MTSRPRTTSFIDAQKAASNNPGGSGLGGSAGMKISSKDGNKVTVLSFFVAYFALSVFKIDVESLYDI